MKRPRPIPKAVRDAVRLMIYGKPDDPDGRPLTFLETAPVVGVKPDTLRRYLDKPTVISLLLRERKAFRHEICAANEASLKGLRDHAQNSMARIAAIRLLEEMNGDDGVHAPGESTQPRFVVQIVNRITAPELPAITIGARTFPAPPHIAGPPYEPEPQPEPEPEPIFTPRRWP